MTKQTFIFKREANLGFYARSAQYSKIIGDGPIKWLLLFKEK
jgi:hypothetical protein